jgi:hypothetical protein
MSKNCPSSIRFDPTTVQLSSASTEGKSAAVGPVYGSPELVVPPELALCRDRPGVAPPDRIPRRRITQRAIARYRSLDAADEP